MTRTAERQNMVCVGVITTVHGVRGNVKVKSFTRKASDFATFGTLYDASGRRSFNVKIVGESKGVFLVAVDGLTDRTAAEALRGTELYVPREKLPETDADEFYYVDLIGMTAKTPDGEILGEIKGVHNFGAGDMLEIDGIDDFVSFSKQNVPDIDLKSRVATVRLPECVEVKPEKPEP
ncbi:MAG TPA: 16S rRNA processing protein RimM [Alphaproteobacteria bacterium]|nr:16S rRNA processing protein RimM [Alphaproteobacteria bacterium]